jgi:Cupin domain
MSVTREEFMARTKAKTKTSARSTRARTTSRRRVLPRAKAKARPKQTFSLSHHRDEDFKVDGLRTYAKYRDLGIKGATNGMVLAHVVRFLPPFRPEVVSKRHFHDVDFQMVYVLKGWIKTELDGEGEHVFRAGSCWLQPPRVKHTVLGYSDDCEVLEIVLPADFKTVELE